MIENWQDLTKGQIKELISISEDEMFFKDHEDIYKFVEEKCDKFCDKCVYECQINTEASSCKCCNKCEWNYCKLIANVSFCRPNTRKDKKLGHWEKIK